MCRRLSRERRRLFLLIGLGSQIGVLLPALAVEMPRLALRQVKLLPLSVGLMVHDLAEVEGAAPHAPGSHGASPVYDSARGGPGQRPLFVCLIGLGDVLEVVGWAQRVKARVDAAARSERLR